MKLNGLDLFSGIGGLTIALDAWVKPIAYCENDRYAQGVLLSRMESGDLPVAPIWDDTTTLQGYFLPRIDIIYGGFPCQDLSVAGLRKGLSGKRSGLFYEIVRLAKEIKPTLVFIENVGQGSENWVPEVRRAFRAIGYRIKDSQITAAEVGTPHERKRWFGLAYPMRLRHWYKNELRRSSRASGENQTDAWLDRKELVDDTSEGLERRYKPESTWEALRQHRYSGPKEWPDWLPKPSLPRGDDGLRYRVERIKSTGNAVVPEQAREAFKRLMGLTEWNS